MKTNYLLAGRKLLVCLFLSFYSLLFSQTRYVDDIFSNVDSKTVTINSAAPQPLPSAAINLFFITIPANSNVPEHITEDRVLNMDIFQPRNDTNTSRPVIIFCFGGGFTLGNRSAPDMRALAIAMARKGYVTATIDYRIGINLFDREASRRAVYRGVQDSRTAIRFFRNDAQSTDTYRINPDQVFIAGYSAGGFVALHNVYLDQENERPSSTRVSSYNYSPNTLFGYDSFELSDMGCLDCEGDFQNISGKANAAISFAGAVGELSYIEGNSDVPALLFHSTDDPAVAFNTGVPYGAGNTQLPEVFGSNAIHNDALQKGAPTRLISYTNRGHSPHIRGDGSFYPEIIPEVADFLFDVLNGDIVSPPPPPPSAAPLNQIISLRKKGGDRKYVTAERFDDNNQLLARADIVQEWETFRVEEHPFGGIALKALSNDKYIQVNGTNQNVPIRARGEEKLGWEQFIWRDVGPGEVALQSAFTNTWIQAAWPQNNAILYPRGQDALGWETFEWRVVPTNKSGALKPVKTTTEVYPNPVRQGELYVHMSMEQASDIQLELFDTSGRQVYANTYKNRKPGGVTLHVQSDQFNTFSGVYLLTIKKNTSFETIKVSF